MGCDESITMEDRPITMKTPQQQSQGATTRPITIEKKMTGLLEKDLHFQDCLIQSENDLENKIRSFQQRNQMKITQSNLCLIFKMIS